MWSLEPIAKRLKQSAESALLTSKKITETEDIVERIKRLENELQDEKNESSDSDSEFYSDPSNDKTDNIVNLSAYASERVDSLPANMLPAANSLSNLSHVCKKRKKTQQEQNELAANKALEHLRDALSFPKRVPFACKPCKFVGKNLDEYQAHKLSDNHVIRVQTGEKLLHCDLCNKSFTSAAQINEHRAGKWHKQRARNKKERFKVKVCYDFMRGECKWGDRCNFMHAETKAMRSGRALGKTSKRVCDSYARTKTCRFGEKCLFSHNPE
ncbi:protein mex-isoform a [Plasmopara halstedii]|uniref:Protein mex-isoform a n=1 Tax=Plasmopara halstedii TaxID=4781 RepID=A0A0P1AMW5_PLAHL|nr:protein mex-isoform a [Plasmopara halstedii]CEG42497.1 protein mex-isoform a [Plasmopara halstedii]|eukprot:XP_024578866.1 protein mex-isoform a [Plasmopara halstedii]